MSRRGWIAVAALVLVGASVAATSCAVAPAKGAAPGGSATVALASWGRQHADMFSALSYDTGTVADDASTYDIRDLVGACQTVSNDVQEYLAMPPVPNIVAARHLRAAFELFERGTGDCIAGSLRSDNDLIVQSRAELDRGTSQLQATRTLLTAAAEN
jgi:hypothetical protein